MCGPTASKDLKAPVNMTGMVENEVKMVSSESTDAKVDMMKGSVNEIESNVSHFCFFDVHAFH